MNSALFVLVCATLLRSEIHAQTVAPSVANSLRYGTGHEIVGDRGPIPKQTKQYLDNVADARLFFTDLTVGFRVELSTPPEYGIPFRGIRKRYIEFAREGLSIRAGDLYALFSRGLALNTFENRALGFDSGVEGIRAEYRSNHLHAMIVGGEIDFVEPLTIPSGAPRSERYSVRGASGEVRPIDAIGVGGSFVWAEARAPSLVFFDQTDTSISRTYEIFTRLHLPYVDIFAAFSERRVAVGGIDSTLGSGFYASFSHVGMSYGVTVEYKDYRFDIADPVRRSVLYRPTRMLPFQNPPTVHKEHSFTLLSRYPYVVDFNDEVGFQIDAFFSPIDDLTLNANYAMASRHYAYEFDLASFTFSRTRIGNPAIPSSRSKRSPFWEIYGEVEYFYDGAESFVKLGANRRVITVFEVFSPVDVQSDRTTGFPLEIQYAFDPIWSLKLNSEHQWVRTGLLQTKYYNHLLAIQLSRAPIYSVGFRHETTTSRDEPNGKRNWFTVEGGYRIGTSHTIALSYGAERGGTVCASGICRPVFPFDGFRLMIVSHF